MQVKMTLKFYLTPWSLQYLKSCINQVLVILPTWKTEIRRITFKTSPGKYFPRLHLQYNQSKMDWRCESSGREPDLKVGSPKFKLQFHQKQTKTKKLDVLIWSLSENIRK
jgi:hypothetical protein